jgi:hypothetical protein
VRFTTVRVSGSPGVVPNLVIDCELTPLGYHPGAAAVLFGEVQATFGAGMSVVGTIVPHPVVLGFPVQQTYVGDSRLPPVLHEQLHLPMDATAVMGLEERRQGGEVRLQTRITALLTSQGTPEANTPTPPGHRTSTSTHPLAHWNGDLLVTREQWYAVLASWGVGLAVPLGVAIPGLLPGRDRSAIAQLLRESVDRLNNGDFSASLVATRQAVELLRTLLPIGQSLPKDIKSRTRAQRRGVLVQALFDLVSAAMHRDHEDGDGPWTREDALLAVSTAAALAQRAFRD